MNFSQIFSTNSLSQRIACAKMYGIVNGASWNRLQTNDWLRDTVQRHCAAMPYDELSKSEFAPLRRPSRAVEDVCDVWF